MNLEFLRPFVNAKVCDGMFNYEKLTHYIEKRRTAPYRRIALVGAGGKTSAMYALGHYFKGQGKKVVLTTTTKVFTPDSKDVDAVCFTTSFPECLLDLGRRENQVIFIGKSFDKNNKVTGFEPEEVPVHCLKDPDVFIYEADGAKRRSIKAPREDEPRLLAETDLVIGVVGLDVLGKPACENFVHRLEKFQEITHIKENERIESQHVGMLVRHPMGLFKDVPNTADKILLLTKMDTEARSFWALAIQEELEDWEGHVISI